MQRGKIIPKNKALAISVFTSALLIVYLFTAFAFSKSLAADRATPTFGAVFIFGRAVMIQFFTISSVAICLSAVANQFRRIICHRALMWIGAVAAAIFLYIIFLFAFSNAVHGLDTLVLGG
jgi:hypothetical protein